MILDVLFNEMITGHLGTDINGAPLPSPMSGYPTLVIAVCVPLSLLLYKYLSGVARFVFWSALLALALLAAESYLTYGVPFVYPHVFQKVMVLFTLTAMYGIYTLFGRITLADLVGMIWIALIINVLIINPKALSISAFVNHERGLVASSVYLLVLPLLFHFNTYLHTRKPIQLFLFFLVAASIFFFQHRTVWVVSIVSLALNGLLLLRAAPQRLSFKALLPLLGIPALLVSIALTTLVVSHPEILTKIGEDIADIKNHDKQGTGEWRVVQTRAYWPYVEQYPILGMRFKGFELPIQFYDPEQPWLVVFPDGHGHFFHSFYMDSLFYLGVVGLLLLCIPQLYVLIRILRFPPLHPEVLAWSVFIATSLVYSYSYALPAYFYGLAGLALVRIKQLATPTTLPVSVSLVEVTEKSSISVPTTYSA
jgi:hypothetical protein